MWYESSMTKYAGLIGQVPDTFCPQCAAKGKKSPINEMERNDKSAIFYSCANWQGGCKYSYNKDRSPTTPPLSGAEVDQLLMAQKQGTVELAKDDSLYCPVCANRGNIQKAIQRNSKNGPFYACTSWKNPRETGCGYKEYQHGAPLTLEQLQIFLKNKDNQILQEMGNAPTEGTVPIDNTPLFGNPLDVFKEMPIVENQPMRCPYGHGELSIAKTEKKTKYCKRCMGILKRAGGDGYACQVKMNPPTFIVNDKISGKKIEIISGELQVPVDMAEINDFNIEKSYIQSVMKDITPDALIYQEANASEENDAGQGSIVQGTIKIMSDEERAALSIDVESVKVGIAKKERFMEETLIEYLDLQHFGDYGDVLQAGTVGGKIIMVSDGGVMDKEKCEKAKQSPLYQFSEIGALGLTPNPSQAAALELIESPEARNIILCLPTGVGKTTIAEWAIADSKRRATEAGFQKTIALYVCPARALAAQVARDLSQSDDKFVHPFMQNGWRTSLLRGVGNDINDDEQHLLRQKRKIGKEEDEEFANKAEPWKKNLSQDPNQSDVIVITPEKLLVSLHQPASNPWIARVSTIIFDEGHLIGDVSRGPNFETEQIQIYEKFKQIRNMMGGAARIIYMSATMQNAIELVAWQHAMSLSNVEPDSTSGFGQERGAKWALVRGEWTPVKIEKEFVAADFGENGMAAAEKVLADIASAGNQVKNKNGDMVMRPSLIFVPSFPEGYLLQRVAKNYYWQCKQCGFVQMGVQGPGGKPLDPGTIHGFECPKCSGKQTMKQWEIPFHNSKESGVEGDEMVENFNNDYQHNPVLIATSTLSAGVNTGAYRVAIFNTARGTSDIETSELLQEVGRSGRQKYLTEFPGANPIVSIYTSPSRMIHDQRRLYANAFLRSRLGRPHKITDSVLRAISTMGVGNAQDAGNYIASTFAYYQNQIDTIEPINVRKGLEHVSNSFDPVEGVDKIQWVDQGRAMEMNALPCRHLNVMDVTRIKGFEHKQMIDTPEGEKIVPVDALNNQQVKGKPLFTCLCKTPLRDSENNIIVNESGYAVTCEALGYMPQLYEPISSEQFVDYIDNSIRDLLAAGLIAQEDNGQYKITTFGRQIVGSNMPVADAVDIIKNMNHLNFDIKTATNWTYALGLGNLRKYNDVEEGAYFSEAQMAACAEAMDMVAKTGLDADGPTIKKIQSLYWILSGIHPKDKDPETKENIIPEAMERDYYSTVDDYKGIFLVGLSVLASRARWFADCPEEFEALKLKIINTSPIGVPTDEMVPLIAAKGIGILRARVLSEIGLSTLPEVLSVTEDELANSIQRFRESNKMADMNCLMEARLIQRIARDALSGEQVNKDPDLVIKSKQYKLQYLYTIKLLNNQDTLRKMWQRRKNIRDNKNPIVNIESFESGLPDAVSFTKGWYKWALDKN